MFYQRHFADSDGRLWRYDRKRKVYEKLFPKVMCVEENLYTSRSEDGLADQRVETDLLAPIDGRTSGIIRKLNTQRQLSGEERGMLAFFMGLQHTRLPSYARSTRRMVEVSTTEMANMQFDSVERMQAVIDEGPYPSPNMTAQKLVDGWKSGNYKIVATEREFLRTMFKIATTIADFLLVGKWTVMVAPEQSGFIFCDHPLTQVFPMNYKDEAGGWAIRGTTGLFPLGRRLCLKWEQNGDGLHFADIGLTAVKTVNMNVAANSERFVMGASKEQLEVIVARSQCSDIREREKYEVDVIRVAKDDSLIRLSSIRSPNFYS